MITSILIILMLFAGAAVLIFCAGILLMELIFWLEDISEPESLRPLRLCGESSSPQSSIIHHPSKIP